MQTKIKVSGSVILSDELTTFVNTKAEKLAVLVKSDPTALCEFEVGVATAGKRAQEMYRAEVHLTFAGGDVYTESNAPTLHGAIDKAVAEARHELKQKKDKDRDLMRRGAAEVKNFFRNFGK